MESVDSGEQVRTVALPITISATTSAPILVFRAPYKCKITGLAIAGQTTIAGNDTNKWTIAFINRGPLGTDTTAVNATDITDVATGGFTAYVARVTPIHATAANSTLAAGDVVTLTLTKAASGANIVMPLVEIKFKGTA